MPCGKKPLVKSWDRPRDIRTVKPSRYQQNEASVKIHWKNVIKELELYYKDEQFWETQAPIVHELVGPVIFERLAKIFNLQMDEEPYVPKSPEPSEVEPSEQFYATRNQEIYTHGSRPKMRPSFSLSDFGEEENQVEEEEDSEDEWSVSSVMTPPHTNPSKSKSLLQQQSSIVKSFSRVMSKTMSRTFNKSFQRSFSKNFDMQSASSSERSARTDDDIIVHAKSQSRLKSGGKRLKETSKLYNPHFEMLYCNDSETDMIKWNSKYKQKTLEVSASDEYSKKAELLTKQIANEFYDWWVSLGSVEFKSEIKRPLDIEDLFQVWFDEHASRGLVLDPKILPCVLQSIATHVGVASASCPRVLKRHLAWDIHAETSPAHTMAFGTCLPLKMKHIPPKNNTKEVWHSVHIPEDLKSMSTVWGEISHLTSSKAFQKWLAQRPHMPMPPCLKDLDQPGDKKQLFVVPSDYIMRDKSVNTFSTQDLNIPVSQFSLEIKEVLSRLLND